MSTEKDLALIGKAVMDNLRFQHMHHDMDVAALSRMGLKNLNDKILVKLETMRKQHNSVDFLAELEGKESDELKLIIRKIMVVKAIMKMRHDAKKARENGQKEARRKEQERQRDLAMIDAALVAKRGDELKGLSAEELEKKRKELLGD